MTKGGIVAELRLKRLTSSCRLCKEAINIFTDDLGIFFEPSLLFHLG